MFLNSGVIRRTLGYLFVYVNIVFLCCQLVLHPSVSLILLSQVYFIEPLTSSSFTPSKLLRLCLIRESIYGIHCLGRFQKQTKAGIADLPQFVDTSSHPSAPSQFRCFSISSLEILTFINPESKALVLAE